MGEPPPRQPPAVIAATAAVAAEPETDSNLDEVATTLPAADPGHPEAPPIRWQLNLYAICHRRGAGHRRLQPARPLPALLPGGPRRLDRRRTGPLVRLDQRHRRRRDGHHRPLLGRLRRPPRPPPDAAAGHVRGDRHGRPDGVRHRALAPAGAAPHRRRRSPAPSPPPPPSSPPSTPKARLGYGLGLIQTAVFAGSSLGPLPGGFLADRIGPRRPSPSPPPASPPPG